MGMVTEIIPDIVEATLLMVVFESLTGRKNFVKENKIRTVLFLLLYIFLSCVSNKSNIMIYHTLFIAIFTMLLMSYFTGTNIFTSAIIYLLFFSVVVSTELIIAVIEMGVFRIDVNQIDQNYNILIFLILVSKLLQIFIVYIIYKHNSIFINYKILNKEGSLFSNYIIQTAVFGFFVIGVNFGIFNFKNTIVYNIIIFIIYFIFIIVGFIDLKEREKIIKINNNYKVQEQQLKNMEEIIKIIREEKHDFANHINVIQALCCLNKPNTTDRIKEYVLKITNSLNSAFKYIDTGNDYIDGFLSLKSNFAAEKDILFEVKIDAYFDMIKIREDELVSIISNIIDNAFDAVNKKLDNKEIYFNTFLEDEEFCIEIANNGEKITDSLKCKIFEKGFSTKVDHKDDHGYGLNITKQLVENNKGKIYVESDEEETSFLIKFKIDKVN